jgi:hypothetical protein
LQKESTRAAQDASAGRGLRDPVIKSTEYWEEKYEYEYKQDSNLNELMQLNH